MTTRVFVTRELPGEGLELLRAECEVEVWPGDVPPTEAQLIDKTGDAHGLLCLLTDPVTRQVIDAAPELRAVSTYAVGFDNIDIAAATARGIPVGHTPGVLTDATADLAWALLMCAARRIVEGAAFARDGRWVSWSPTALLGGDVQGATLGILGMGRIGRAVARRARGFEMEVIFHTPSLAVAGEVEGARYVELDELLARSDYLSLHAPLTDTTRGIIDRGALAKMKPGAVLINTARGPMVDQEALHEALTSGQLGYAALDVTDPEPLPADHPLYALDNCVIVPHLGSGNVTTRARMSQMAAEHLLAGLRGELPACCVNPEALNRG